MSYKWQSDPKHWATQQSTDTTCFFCAEKKRLDSQLLSGRDQDPRPLLEMLINTESRL